MKIRAFITHKLAECYKDCQDRFCINSDTKTIAVSDGMGQSIFPELWAELLTNTYANEKEWEPTEDNIKNLCDEWYKTVLDRKTEMEKAGRATWLLENSLNTGKSAGATFVGIRFEGNKWKGCVLGDSCLIKIDKDKKITEIISSEERPFDSYPDYFNSNPKIPGRGMCKPIEGELQKGELLLLVTDPFSEYLSQISEQKKDSIYIDQLLKLESNSEFESLVENWRAEGMHNDDSTLVIIETDNLDEFNVNEELLSKLISEEENSALLIDQQREQISLQESNQTGITPSETTESSSILPLSQQNNNIESVIENTTSLTNKDDEPTTKELESQLNKTLELLFDRYTNEGEKNPIAKIKGIIDAFLESKKKFNLCLDCQVV